MAVIGGMVIVNQCSAFGGWAHPISHILTVPFCDVKLGRKNKQYSGTENTQAVISALMLNICVYVEKFSDLCDLLQ